MTAIDPMPAANSAATDAAGPRLAQPKNGSGDRKANSLTIWVSDSLLRALKTASAFEEEPMAVLARRWLRMAAHQQGFYPKAD
jgi:hypothetical protein